MSIELWLAFVAASAVLLIIPGPTILTVISYSVAHGRRANVPLGRGSHAGRLDRTGGLAARLGRVTGHLGVLVHGDQVGGRLLPALPRRQAAARRDLAGRTRGARCARFTLEAVRQHLSGHGPEPQGHRVLRGLPAAVHQPARRCDTAALATGDHLRGNGDAERYALRGVRGLRRGKLLASPRAQRRFNLAGGSLLSVAGIWALLARRPG